MSALGCQTGHIWLITWLGKQCHTWATSCPQQPIQSTDSKASPGCSVRLSLAQTLSFGRYPACCGLEPACSNYKSGTGCPSAFSESTELSRNTFSCSNLADKIL